MQDVKVFIKMKIYDIVSVWISKEISSYTDNFENDIYIQKLVVDGNDYKSHDFSTLLF